MSSLVHTLGFMMRKSYQIEKKSLLEDLKHASPQNPIPDVTAIDVNYLLFK